MQSPNRFIKTFPSDQELIGAILSEIVVWLRGRDIQTAVCENVEIVLVEALNNVIEHAYLFEKTGLVSTEIGHYSQTVTATIRDWGKARSDFSGKRSMDHSASELNDLPEGGFGLFMMQSLTQEMTYERIEDENVLSLTFAI